MKKYDHPLDKLTKRKLVGLLAPAANDFIEFIHEGKADSEAMNEMYAKLRMTRDVVTRLEERGISNHQVQTLSKCLMRIIDFFNAVVKREMPEDVYTFAADAANEFGETTMEIIAEVDSEQLEEDGGEQSFAI